MIVPGPDVVDPLADKAHEGEVVDRHARGEPGLRGQGSQDRGLDSSLIDVLRQGPVHRVPFGKDGVVHRQDPGRRPRPFHPDDGVATLRLPIGHQDRRPGVPRARPGLDPEMFGDVAEQVGLPRLDLGPHHKTVGIGIQSQKVVHIPDRQREIRLEPVGRCFQLQISGAGRVSLHPVSPEKEKREKEDEERSAGSSPARFSGPRVFGFHLGRNTHHCRVQCASRGRPSETSSRNGRPPSPSPPLRRQDLLP